jgi:hypothetical protein
MNPLCLPDELRWARPEHLDPDLVAAYEQKAAPSSIPDDIETLRRLGLTSSSTVVDIGAGTGLFCRSRRSVLP